MESEILRYIELLKYLKIGGSGQSENLEKFKNTLFEFLPKNLQKTFSLSNEELLQILKKNVSTDPKSYNTFCLIILKIILLKCNISICYINNNYFDHSLIFVNDIEDKNLFDDNKFRGNCAFILKHKETNLFFSFFNKGDEKKLQQFSDYIYSIDNHCYKNIHIVIFLNAIELDEARQTRNAETFKRSFFTSFDIICKKANELDRSSFEKILSSNCEYGRKIQKPDPEIDSYQINVIENIPVGKNGSKLFKLSFDTVNHIDIQPGQFIMMSTLIEKNKFQLKVLDSLSESNPCNDNDLQLKQIPFLKRPFGIYRAYYENFDFDFLSKLDIEKHFASILYIIKPSRFEILYKVLEKGTGTNELTKLVKNDKIEILAPLGKIFDFRDLLKEEIDEIHIVGGGVGIAPLIYLVQTLRFFNIKIKAFIGIETYNSLTYYDADADSFTGTGRNAKIYIDDLKVLGLDENTDIYVSILNPDNEKFNDIKNVAKGCVVTEPYSEYLNNHNHLKIITFTCGPLPMMRKVHYMTEKYRIKSFALMEKRMACGIGVCFSCVCKTNINGELRNSRVCIDGPVIETKIIDWNE